MGMMERNLKIHSSRAVHYITSFFKAVPNFSRDIGPTETQTHGHATFTFSADPLASLNAQLIMSMIVPIDENREEGRGRQQDRRGRGNDVNPPRARAWRPQGRRDKVPVYGVPGRRSLQTRHVLMKRRRDAGVCSTTVVMISSIEKLILYRVLGVANRQQGTQAELFGQRDDAI